MRLPTVALGTLKASHVNFLYMFCAFRLNLVFICLVLRFDFLKFRLKRFVWVLEKAERGGCFLKPPGEGQIGPHNPAPKVLSVPSVLPVFAKPPREPAPTQTPSSTAPPCLALGLI